MFRSRTMPALLALTAIAASLLLQGCSGPKGSGEIILATTTSTYDSGLLDAIIPEFEENSGHTVKTVAVGTGKALQMGRDGNADLLFVHAPSAEEELVAEGYATERRLVMHNDFVLVGPASDPADIGSATTAAKALGLISGSASNWVSRGDDSGTHKMERALWASAGPEPSGDWFAETGQGMGATLRIASEKGGYTLTDRGTFLALREGLELQILFEGDPVLLNIYHVMLVNPERHPETNVKSARALADYVTSRKVQKTIGEFGVDKYGQPLFFPDADKTDQELMNP